MTILLVIPSLLVGGAEVFVVRLANHLTRRGHRVFLLHFDPDRRSSLLEERIGEEVTVVPFTYQLSWVEKLWWKLLYTTTQWNEVLYDRVVFKRNQLKAEKLGNFLEVFCAQEHIQVINSHLLLADWMVALYFGRKKRAQKFVISMHGCYNRIEQRDRSVFHYIQYDRP